MRRSKGGAQLTQRLAGVDVREGSTDSKHIGRQELRRPLVSDAKKK